MLGEDAAAGGAGGAVQGTTGTITKIGCFSSLAGPVLHLVQQPAFWQHSGQPGQHDVLSLQQSPELPFVLAWAGLAQQGEPLPPKAGTAPKTITRAETPIHQYF
jgi:hypothetical protein